MTLRTALLLIGGLTLITGLVIGIILVSQRQLLSKKAAVSGGITTLRLEPGTANMAVGETITVNGVLNTGSAQTRGYQIIASYAFTGAVPPIEVVGNQATSLIPEFSLCQQNSVSVANNTVTITVACSIPTGNNTPTYTTSGQDVNAFSIQLRGVTASESVSIVFDNTESQVPNATPGNDYGTDMLSFPTGGTYTVVALTNTPTPSPTGVPGATVTPTPTGVPGATVTPSPVPTITPTPVPGAATATPTPTSGSSPTNTCGGTCGSNANCSSDLFCDTATGTCRNAQCPTSTNCSCTGVPAATATPTQIPAVGGDGGGDTELEQAGTVSSTIILGLFGLVLVTAGLIFL